MSTLRSAAASSILAPQLAPPSSIKYIVHVHTRYARVTRLINYFRHQIVWTPQKNCTTVQLRRLVQWWLCYLNLKEVTFLYSYRLLRSMHTCITGWSSLAYVENRMLVASRKSFVTPCACAWGKVIVVVVVVSTKITRSLELGVFASYNCRKM